MKCQFCDAKAEYYCDFILGWNKNRMWHTCDAPMCANCKTQVGMHTLCGVDSIDHCPIHLGADEVATFTAETMTASQAEAIRRRNKFKIAKAD